MAQPATRQRQGRSPAAARLASRFVLVLLAVGSLVLWVGIPVAAMWAMAQLTEDAAQHFVLTLLTVLLGMTLFAKGLFWLNRLYLRITLDPVLFDEADEEGEEDEPRWARGPLEPLLVGSLIVALVLLFAWFFLLAENPSPQVI